MHEYLIKLNLEMQLTTCIYMYKNKPKMKHFGPILAPLSSEECNGKDNRPYHGFRRHLDG